MKVTELIQALSELPEEDKLLTVIVENGQSESDPDELNVVRKTKPKEMFGFPDKPAIYLAVQ